MKASERSMMIEHIMDADMPGNLALALDTVDVIYDVQKQILVAGARDLIERLTVSASEGRLHCIDDDFTKDPMKRWAHLTFRKDHWPTGHAIGIEADAGNAGKVFVGVATGTGSMNERLREMLMAVHAGGTGNEHWPWWYWVAAPYDRWTSKEALLRFRSGEAVTELASQLGGFIGIVDEYCAGRPHLVTT